MDIQLHKKSPIEGTITIQIQAPDYEDKVSEKLHTYSKKARIKGFRAGHVPDAVLQKMYGPSVLSDTVLALLHDKLSKYLQESNLTIIGEPMPDESAMQPIDWTAQREFVFVYDIGWGNLPDFDFAAINPVTGYEINQVADETIDKISQEIQKTYGEKQEASHTALGDTVYGILSCTHASDCAHKALTKKVRFVLDSSQEKTIGSWLNLQVGDKLVVDLPALIEQGMKPLGLTDPVLKELLSLEEPLEFKLDQIERIIPAELDQNLFDRAVGEATVDSIEGFRSQLQALTIRNKQKEADRYLEQALQTALLKDIPVELPDQFLQRWLQYKHQDLTQAQITQDYPNYAQALKWELILKQIIQTHHLHVSADAVNEATKIRFQSFYQLPDATLDQLVQNFLQENQGENYKRMYQELLMDQVFNLLKEQVNMHYQTISVEDFDQLTQ